MSVLKKAAQSVAGADIGGFFGAFSTGTKTVDPTCSSKGMPLHLKLSTLLGVLTANPLSAVLNVQVSKEGSRETSTTQRSPKGGGLR